MRENAGDEHFIVRGVIEALRFFLLGREEGDVNGTGACVGGGSLQRDD